MHPSVVVLNETNPIIGLSSPMDSFDAWVECDSAKPSVSRFSAREVSH